MQGVEWPDGVKSRALALSIQTGNISQAARQLREELDGNGPPIRTVNVWVQKANPELYQQIANNKAAILQSRWSDVELAALDEVEEKIEGGKIEAKDLTIIAGISADKRIAVENLNARFKGGNRFQLFKMMARMEEAVAKGGSVVSAEAVMLEGEMP